MRVFPRSSLAAALAGAIFLGLGSAAGAAPAMWKVSDADSSVWLFGSIHVLPRDIAWRTPVFDDVLARADTVYFEADIGPLGEVGIVIKSLQMGMQPHDPWIDRLSPEQQSKLGDAVEPLGLSTQQLLAVQPWLAEAMIEDKVLEHQGFSMDLGVDPTLQAELPKERKAYFETAGEQMDMLAGAPIDAQVKRFVAAVDDIPNMPGELRDMAASWSSGKVDDLAAQMTDDPTMDEGFTRTMVLDRNARWVGAIKGLLADNHQDLIVVGAGHLAGDGSVVDLLAKAGFTVERIQ